MNSSGIFAGGCWLCGWRGRSGKHPGQRGERGVEETDRERQQQNRRSVAALINGFENDEEEEKAEQQLDERGQRLHRLVAALFPVNALHFLADAVFRRADEGGLVIEEGFDHGFGIVDGHADAEREQQRKIGNFPPPRIRPKRLLRGEVEDDDGNGSEEEDRPVDGSR